MNQFQVFPAADEFQLDLVDILADDLTLHLAGNGFLKGGKVGLEQFFQYRSPEIFHDVWGLITILKFKSFSKDILRTCYNFHTSPSSSRSRNRSNQTQ